MSTTGYPEGFRSPRSLVDGMECERCGLIVCGVGYTLQELADDHHSRCFLICTRCQGYDPSVARCDLPEGASYCTPLRCDAWSVTHRLTKQGLKPVRSDGRADLREVSNVDSCPAAPAGEDSPPGDHCDECGLDLTPTPEQLEALVRWGNPLRRQPCLKTASGLHRVAAPAGEDTQ
jgi:hypothetical protein